MQRRGPTSKYTDAELVKQISALLAASPFHGEAHRKSWERQRVPVVRTSKPRVLRLLRKNGPLAQQRELAPVAEKPHAGSIVTGEPIQMWCIDATVTLADRQVTVVVAVDHCAGECLDIHAVKSTTRVEVLEPLRQGVCKHFGAFGPKAAAGLRIRHDFRSHDKGDHFQKGLRSLGMVSSPAIVRQPGGNATGESFMKTLKYEEEHRREYRDLAEARTSIQVFLEKVYNQKRLHSALGSAPPAEFDAGLAARNRKDAAARRLPL